MYIFYFFFFFNDTATTEIYTLSLHDALPISREPDPCNHAAGARGPARTASLHDYQYRRIEWPARAGPIKRSEEHTSELQSQSNLVCRLLLEKKKKNRKRDHHARKSVEQTYKR